MRSHIIHGNIFEPKTGMTNITVLIIAEADNNTWIVDLVLK